jgi:hypothetical protein
MSTNHHAEGSTKGDQRDWSRHTQIEDAELEASDRREGHDYVPMDLYIANGDRREHFAAAAILERLHRVRRASARRRTERH